MDYMFFRDRLGRARGLFSNRSAAWWCADRCAARTGRRTATSPCTCRNAARRYWEKGASTIDAERGLPILSCTWGSGGQQDRLVTWRLPCKGNQCKRYAKVFLFGKPHKERFAHLAGGAGRCTWRCTFRCCASPTHQNRAIESILVRKGARMMRRRTIAASETVHLPQGPTFA